MMTYLAFAVLIGIPLYIAYKLFVLFVIYPLGYILGLITEFFLELPERYTPLAKYKRQQRKIQYARDKQAYKLKKQRRSRDRKTGTSHLLTLNESYFLKYMCYYTHGDIDISTVDRNTLHAYVNKILDFRGVYNSELPEPRKRAYIYYKEIIKLKRINYDKKS